MRGARAETPVVRLWGSDVKRDAEPRTRAEKSSAVFPIDTPRICGADGI
jgi:hypothetical protein